MKQKYDFILPSGKFSVLNIIMCMVTCLLLSGCYTTRSYHHDRGRHHGHHDRVVVVMPNGNKYGQKYYEKSRKQREKAWRKQEKARQKQMKKMWKHRH